MNMHPAFSNLRSSLTYTFFKLRTRAINDAFRNMLTGSKTALEVFPGTVQRVSPNRKLIHNTDIHVADIAGTLEQNTDFDRQFRPLKKHSVDRWVNIYLLYEQDGWPPIVVHKVDGKYFVEDGHHRVSVARAIGVEFIEAKVWEYTSPQSKPKEVSEPAACHVEKHREKVYAAG